LKKRRFKMEYKELDDPVKEVYRIRKDILKEFDYDIKAYHAYTPGNSLKFSSGE
jgi:hypothetical protein